MWSLARRASKHRRHVMPTAALLEPARFRSLHPSQPPSLPPRGGRALIHLGSIHIHLTGANNGLVRNFFSSDNTPPPPPQTLPNDDDDALAEEAELHAFHHHHSTVLSIDSPATGDIVHAIERSTNDISSEAVSLAFLLISRLMQTTRAGTWQEAQIPPDILNRVISTWRASWQEGATATTPNFVFIKIRQHDQQQEPPLVPALQPDLMTYNMIIDATKWNRQGSKRPDIAEKILDYLIEASSTTNPKLRPDSTTFNSVMDAWAQCDWLNAPLGAEGVLKKMRQYSKPDVVSYNCVIAAWAAAKKHENAPHRVRELLAEMKEMGLEPDRFSYMGALAALIKSENEQDMDHAANLLTQMYHLYEQGDVEMKPDSECYSVIISTCASRGNLAKAEAILNDQLELYQSTNDRDFLPNADCFKKLVKAWCKADTDGSLEMAETALRRMQDLAFSLEDQSFIPDVATFNLVLYAWAKSDNPSAPQRCENILHMMQDLYHAGYSECRPNLVSYNSAITCWGKSAEQGSTERAEAIFRNLMSEYESGDETCKPDAALYSNMMEAWANSDIPDAAERGQELFDELKRRCATGDREAEPSPRMAQILIKLWSRSEQPGAAVKAQAVFDEMQTLFRTSGDPSMKPDFYQYNDLIHAWAKIGEAEKAEEILRRMVSNIASGVYPTKISYNEVLHAWARSAHPEAPERAHNIFDSMMKMFDAGFQELKPDNVTFGILITSWSRSGRKDSAIQAKSVFDTMVAEYEAGDENCKPEVSQVSAFINALAQIGAAKDAEMILRQLEAGSFDGLKPNAICYNSVINAWANSKSPAAPIRAQAIYDLMKQKHLAGEIDLKPNNSTMSTLITAWGRSRNENSAPTAQALLDEMLSAAAYPVPGGEVVKPRVIEFNAVIDAWAKVGNGERAEQILRQIETNRFEGVKPTVATYTSVISAWSRSGHQHATTRGTALFDEMKGKYERGDGQLKPNLRTYVSLITLLSRSKQRLMTEKAQFLFDEVVAKYQAGDADLKPDVYLFTAIIDAWAKVGQVENADLILQEMYEKFGVKPTFSTYMKVLNSWASSSRPNAAERAQAVFDMMQRQYDDGDNDAKPDLQIHGIMMKLWGQTASYKGASRAQTIFDKQCARYMTGDADLQPNLIQYNTLMDAWCKAGEAERAETILEYMWTHSKLQECPAPDTRSFSIVAGGWARLRRSDAAMRAEKLLRMLQKLYRNGFDCQPDKFLYTSVMKAWIGSGHDDWTVRVESLIREMASEASAGNRSATPDVVPCKMYLNALAKSALPDKANRAFNLMTFMKQHGIEEDRTFREVADLLQRTR